MEVVVGVGKISRQVVTVKDRELCCCSELMVVFVYARSIRLVKAIEAHPLLRA